MEDNSLVTFVLNLTSGSVSGLSPVNREIKAADDGVKFWDEELLAMAPTDSEIAYCVLWTCEPMYTVGYGDARSMQRKGYWIDHCDTLPVVQRLTGGQAVYCSPQDLTMSIVLSSPHRGVDVYETFRLCCKVLIDLMEKLTGIVLETGSIPGSFCDGKFNLVWEGFKVGGTVLRQCSRGVVFHGWLFVAEDVRDRTAMVSRFYRLIGEDRHFDSDTILILDKICDQPLSPVSIMQKLIDLNKAERQILGDYHKEG